jgi:hypothetical protein
LRVGCYLVEVFINNEDVSEGLRRFCRNRVLDTICAPLEGAVVLFELLENDIHYVATDSTFYFLKTKYFFTVKLCGRAGGLNLVRKLVAELVSR